MRALCRREAGPELPSWVAAFQICKEWEAVCVSRVQGGCSSCFYVSQINTSAHRVIVVLYVVNHTPEEVI